MITLITVWSTSTPAGSIPLFNIISDISLLMKLPSRFSNDHKHIDFNSILFQNKNSKQITSITFLSHPPPITHSKQWSPLRVKYKKRSKVRRRDFCGSFSTEPKRRCVSAPTTKTLFYKATKSP